MKNDEMTYNVAVSRRMAGGIQVPRLGFPALEKTRGPALARDDGIGYTAWESQLVEDAGEFVEALFAGDPLGGTDRAEGEAAAIFGVVC